MGKCSSCGAEFAADAPGGHCPRCLLQLGLAAAESPALKAGDRLGHYKLLEPLGEGGCGVVFLAEQEEPVRRRVALKVIKAGMDTAQVMARFEAERQVLALLDHPNIATIFDAGTTDSGRSFFVMEWVRGVKITDYCDRHKLATRERLELFVQVCQAVQHAHQKGVIHRDLKPSNILVTESADGRAPMPKIIDFGIAKSTGQELADFTLLTALQAFLGTPAYMSPEQAGAMDIDTRADIYSLGVLLYELLTGLTPFDATDLRRRAADEVLRFIRENEPPRPSTRLANLTPPELTTVADCRGVEPTRLPRLLRGDLDLIVMKCLEKDRRRRYETASGLGEDLRHHLANERVAARPPGNAYRFQKWARRHRVAFAAASGIVAALVIGLGISTWLFFKERAARQRAVKAEAAERELRLEAEAIRKIALTEAGKSREVATFLETMLRGVGPSAARGRDNTMLREILDRTAERIGRDLPDQPDVEAELRGTLAETYGELGLYGPMETMAQRALVLLRTKPDAESREIAVALSQLSDAELHLGKLGAAEAAARETLAMDRKLLGNADPAVAVALGNLGAVLWAEHKSAEAETLDREALAIVRKSSTSSHADVAARLENVARDLVAQGRTTEAALLFHEAADLKAKDKK